jgi:cytochrome bd-type quinol oxidase subunit 2
MELDPSRLRRGEMLAGASAVLLAVFLVAGKWYGDGRPGGSLTGWQALTDLRWLMVVTIVAAAGLVFAQATRRAPAVPVTMSLVVMLLGIVTVVALIFRVLISPSPHQEVAAYLGLLSAIGITLGGYLSLRQEGIAPRDEPADIPIVRPGRGSES